MDEATQAVHRRLLASQRPPVPLPVAHSVTGADGGLASAGHRPRAARRPAADRRPSRRPAADRRPSRRPAAGRRPPRRPAAGRGQPRRRTAGRRQSRRRAAGRASVPPSPRRRSRSIPSSPPSRRPPVAVNPVAAPVRTVTPARGGAASAALARARAHTLIGVASPRPSADGTVTRSPLEATARARLRPTRRPPPSRPQRVVEIRVPGAAFTLPANPLSELGSEDLASFIDCTLFETDAEEVDARIDDDSGPTREMRPPEARRPPPRARAGRARDPAGRSRGASALRPVSTPVCPRRRESSGPASALSALLVVVGVAIGVALHKPSPAGPRPRRPRPPVPHRDALAPRRRLRRRRADARGRARGPAPPSKPTRAPAVVEKVAATRPRSRRSRREALAPGVGSRRRLQRAHRHPARRREGVLGGQAPRPQPHRGGGRPLRRGEGDLPARSLSVGHAGGDRRARRRRWRCRSGCTGRPRRWSSARRRRTPRSR